MLNYFTSFGASTAFEKNRLIVTSKNLDAPEEHILKSYYTLMKKFSKHSKAKMNKHDHKLHLRLL